MSTRLIGRSVRGLRVLLDEALSQKISFHLVATDIRKHLTIDLNTWAKHLTALLNHFLALGGIIDDVTILEWQVVFAHDGPNALTPATRWFQISNNLWFIHS